MPNMPVNAGKSLLATLLMTVAAPVTAQSADRIWFGGPILTMDDKAMWAEAIAESGGRILAVGSRADVLKTRGAKTQIVDLKGRTLLPGFVDAHGHVMVGGLQALSANLLAPPDGEVRDIPSLQATVREWARANAQTIAAANLMIGFGYDHSQLKELRHPTREEVDAISSDVPVMLVHQSGHMGAFNGAALKLAGITADSKDPPGGVIRRKSGTQEPDGVLEEAAFFNALGKVLPALGPKGFKTFAREGAKLWASFGYTTAQEGRAMAGKDRVYVTKFSDGSALTSMLNAKLAAHAFMPFATLIETMLAATPARDRLERTSILRSLTLAKQGAVQVQPGHPVWGGATRLFPEVFDGLRRAELADLGRLPAWAGGVAKNMAQDQAPPPP